MNLSMGMAPGIGAQSVSFTSGSMIDQCLAPVVKNKNQCTNQGYQGCYGLIELTGAELFATGCIFWVGVGQQAGCDVHHHQETAK